MNQKDLLCIIIGITVIICALIISFNIISYYDNIELYDELYNESDNFGFDLNNVTTNITETGSKSVAASNNVNKKQTYSDSSESNEKWSYNKDGKDYYCSEQEWAERYPVLYHERTNGEGQYDVF